MIKKECILKVNNHLGYKQLKGSNTNYSNINVGKDVWWFNISPERFNSELHLILAKDLGFIWLKIPANSFSNLNSIFKIRHDKNVVDIEISSDSNYRYLTDVKSGGAGFDFGKHVEKLFN